jgi:hypothetical protein
MARRRPELFVGSGFIAGLALGGFLRSSAGNGVHGEYRVSRGDAGASYSGTGVQPGSRPYTGTGASARAATPSTSTPPYNPDGGLVP